MNVFDARELVREIEQYNQYEATRWELRFMSSIRRQLFREEKITPGQEKCLRIILKKAKGEEREVATAIITNHDWLG